MNKAAAAQSLLRVCHFAFQEVSKSKEIGAVSGKILQKFTGCVLFYHINLHADLSFLTKDFSSLLQFNQAFKNNEYLNIKFYNLGKF